MLDDGDAARKRAVECIRFADNTTDEERSAVLRAMARSWVMLATQMDRLEASQVLEKNRTLAASGPLACSSKAINRA
jgi:hypothetical protein